MSLNEKRPIDLKRAFRGIAAQAAPGAPDIDRAMDQSLLRTHRAPRSEPRIEPSRRLRFLLLPVAAAFAFGLGGALLCVRLVQPSALAAEDPDPLLSSANAQAAASVGLSPFDGEVASEPESSGMESDLLSYLEALWTLPADEVVQQTEI